ncbi:MAG: hypothetical protein JWO46_1624, partial [Nocardioidaceae bacterium]|nr:hypothetical protein [Nocardioidaceae bacterium]
MTELLSRRAPVPRTPSATRPSGGPPTAPPRRPAARPLSVSAGLAGLGAACGGLVVLMAIAVTGWFLADGGAHGDTRDALRVGADAWLVGHGSHLTFGGVDYTVVPLGLTLLLAWTAFRSGRWAGRVSPTRDERELAVGAGLFTAAYVVVAVVTSVLAATDEIRGSLVLTLVGGLVMSLLGAAGVVSGSHAWDVATARVPAGVRAWAGPTLRAVAATVLGFLACSSALVAVAFVMDLGNAATIVSRLGLRGGDPLMLVLLSAVLAPNAVLLGGAYLLGPGFAVGVGTTVSPSVVLLGPVPAFPLLAALPDDGPTPWFAAASMVVPALAAFVGVALVQRRSPVLAWDSAALRGIGSGVLAGIVTGLVGGLAGGALGTGRMADIGPSVGALVVAATMAMGVGGLLGALVATAFQRRAA